MSWEDMVGRGRFFFFTSLIVSYSFFAHLVYTHLCRYYKIFDVLLCILTKPSSSPYKSYCLLCPMVRSKQTPGLGKIPT